VTGSHATAGDHAPLGVKPGSGDAKPPAPPARRKSAALAVALVLMILICDLFLQAAAEQALFGSAHTIGSDEIDADILRRYVTSCQICRRATQAREEIERHERQAEESAMYQAARGSLDRLYAYLGSCKVCQDRAAVLAEIRSSTAKSLTVKSFTAKIPSDKIAADKFSTDKMPTAKILTDRIVADKIPADKPPTDQIPPDRIPAAKPAPIPAIQMPSAPPKPPPVAPAIPPPLMPPVVEPPRATFRMYTNLDLYGGDQTKITGVDLAGCENACRSQADCVAYSFDRWNGYCHVKTTITSLRVEPRSDTGIRSDQPPPSRSADPVIMENYHQKTFADFSYLSFFGVRLDACREQCRTDQRCIAFTYTKADRVCKLFAKTGQYFPDAGSESGVKDQPAN
jgi:hypothetical protein